MPPSVTATPAVTSSKRNSTLMMAVAVLAFAGVLVSSFSLYHHFATSKTSFCDLGQSFNCDLVNRSQYSIVLGLPVALIGIIGYLLLLALATFYREKAETPVTLLIAATGGLVFALRLTYIEAFVLKTWCILCLSSLAIIFAIGVISTILAARTLQSHR